jgi:hypothetical protein
MADSYFRDTVHNRSGSPHDKNCLDSHWTF